MSAVEQQVMDAQELANIAELLRRYGVWSMDRHKKQRCASAERAYVAPPNDDDRQPKTVFLPDFDAMRVHRAVVRVPQPFRTVLFAQYVQTRIPLAAAKRRLGMSWQQFEAAHSRALLMFRNLYRIDTKSNLS